jgi:hypothetical protein
VVEISPEPSTAEREALLAALARGNRTTPGSYGSVWRLAGLLESVESDLATPVRAAPVGAPRSSPGASRA